MLRVSMHQPNFLPYVGFFSKIAKSDLFVIVDHVGFSKGKDNWHHRNRIRIPTGWEYITMPVSDHYNFKPFTSVTLNGNSKRFKKKHIKTFQQHYSRSEHFEDVFDSFKQIYSEEQLKLSEFNIDIILWAMKQLNIKAKVVRSSELEFNKEKTKSDMIIEIMKTVSGDTFISGDGAKSYIEKEKFDKEEIGLEFLNFTPKEYNQVYPGFIPNLSVIDLLFNKGKSAYKYL